MDKIAATLFGKTRRAALAILYGQPDQKFYLRELSRLTGIGPGPLQKELELLSDADIVLREPDGNRVNFSANTRSPIFHELAGLIEKTCGAPGIIGGALDAIGDKITHAAIYGSLAKGTSHSRSDIDLMVIGNAEFGNLVSALGSAEERIGREISPRLYSESEFLRRLEEGDRFLNGVVRGPLIIIKGDWDGLGITGRPGTSAGAD